MKLKKRKLCSMRIDWIIWFVGVLVLSVALSAAVKNLALRFGIVDVPSDSRKIHTAPVARAGGIAIYSALAIALILLLQTSNVLTSGQISQWHYIGFLLGGLILIIGGTFDDKFNLPPRVTFLFPVAASATAILFGIEISKLTNPFGGTIMIEKWQSDIIVFVWLLCVMYTTKFLDGLDGLAAGVSAIGSLMIMLLSLSVAYFQPDVALFSFVCLGVLLGFLVLNFNPARLFLGEGGSTFVGYILGVLAVISGGKLATAALVIGIPALDAVWVILRRARTGGIKQIVKADRKHLHHRLLDAGLSQRRTVFLYYLLAAGFGASALFLQSREKLIAVGILSAVMIAVAVALVIHERKKI